MNVTNFYLSFSSHFQRSRERGAFFFLVSENALYIKSSATLPTISTANRIINVANVESVPRKEGVTESVSTSDVPSIGASVVVMFVGQP